MDEPVEMTPMNVALAALMRLHAKVGYVIELLEEESDEEAD